VQRSVYLFDNATKEDLTQLVDKILPLLDKEVDDLRVYKIIDKGIHLGEAVDLENPLIF
jgi:CRISPR/Cas system-associated endoribonuclease Cas2